MSTPVPIGTLSAPSATCKDGTNQVVADRRLPSDSYIKVNTSTQADVSGQVSGWCDTYVWGVFYPPSERRNINFISVEAKAPSQGWTWSVVTTFPPAQSLDTQNGYTSGPVSVGVNEEGEHQIKFQTHAMSTACLVPTDSDVVLKKLNAVSCLPTWVQSGGGPLLTSFPQDGTKLKVVYAVGLDGVANSALLAWKTALNAAGRTNFDYELVPYEIGGTNCGTSGNCVQVGFNLSTCNQPTACGCFAAGERTGGVYSSPSIITLRGDWNTNLKIWVIGHEFGHLLGLDHADTCVLGASVMTRAGETCSPTDLITATSSDAWPVSKAVYGGGPTKTCGW